MLMTAAVPRLTREALDRTPPWAVRAALLASVVLLASFLVVSRDTGLGPGDAARLLSGTGVRMLVADDSGSAWRRLEVGAVVPTGTAPPGGPGRRGGGRSPRRAPFHQVAPGRGPRRHPVNGRRRGCRGGRGCGQRGVRAPWSGRPACRRRRGERRAGSRRRRAPGCAAAPVGADRSHAGRTSGAAGLPPDGSLGRSGGSVPGGRGTRDLGHGDVRPLTLQGPLALHPGPG